MSRLYPSVCPAAEKLANDRAGQGDRDPVPAESIKLTDNHQQGDGRMNADDPAQRILGCGFAQITQREIAGEGNAKKYNQW